MVDKLARMEGDNFAPGGYVGSRCGVCSPPRATSFRKNKFYPRGEIKNGPLGFQYLLIWAIFLSALSPTWRRVVSNILRQRDLHQLQREQLQRLEWERQPLNRLNLLITFEPFKFINYL
jgi:hypothetical protein